MPLLLVPSLNGSIVITATEIFEVWIALKIIKLSEVVAKEHNLQFAIE
jgi:hypothetical protein